MSDLRKQLLRPWRLRFAMFGLGFAGVCAIVLALFWRDLDIGSRPTVVAMVVASFVIGSGLLYWFYHQMTKELLYPLMSLARSLEAQKHSGAAFDPKEYQASIISSFAQSLSKEEERLISGDAVSEGWLSQLLHVIDQGLIVATLDHEILLVNTRAREMLGRSHALALGRDVSALIDIEGIKHSIERLKDVDSTGSERVFCRILTDGRILPARISAIYNSDEAISGYVIGLHDMVSALFRTQEMETAFEGLLKSSRSYASEMRLLQNAGLSLDATQDRFERDLQKIRKDGLAHFGAAWPKGRMTLQQFFRLVSTKFPDIKTSSPPRKIFMRCDGAAIVETLTELFEHLLQAGYALELDYELFEEEIKIKIASHGQRILLDDIDVPMRTALTRLPTAPTGEEVLRAHRTEIWPHEEDNAFHLVFILKRITNALSLDASRPEYYDFETKTQVDDFNDIPLRELPVVVFDSETTGLDPRGGDKVVQLSAVRVRSGKVILHEHFDELVNPERKIPSASTKIHGISDEMVKNARRFVPVVQDFHEFCHGEVLLAHNAAFDMAFLKREEVDADLSFDQPVLDTVFMSAFLFDFTGQHHLDDLAKRVGVTIPEALRHTAFGDAVATAEVFVKLLPMLEARGVKTLGQMIEIGQEMRAIRKRQAQYSN